MTNATFYPFVGAAATIVMAVPAGALLTHDEEPTLTVGFEAGLTHLGDSAGTVSLTPRSASSVPIQATSPDQWYYWTSTWQRNESVALREYASGNFQEFDTVDELLAWLDADEA